MAEPMCIHCGGSGQVTYLSSRGAHSASIDPVEVTLACECVGDVFEEPEVTEWWERADRDRDLQWDREHEDRPDYADEEAA